MAAPTATSDQPKDISNYYHYAVDLEPDRDVIKYYIEQIVRCQTYRDDFKDCESKAERKEQRYIYGEEISCKHFENAYNNCEAYREYRDKAALEKLIKYEEVKAKFRMNNAKQNDVWRYRTSPPDDWNLKVPGVKAVEEKKDDTEFLLEKFENVIEKIENEPVKINMKTIDSLSSNRDKKLCCIS